MGDRLALQVFERPDFSPTKISDDAQKVTVKVSRSRRVCFSSYENTQFLKEKKKKKAVWRKKKKKRAASINARAGGTDHLLLSIFFFFFPKVAGTKADGYVSHP